MAKTNFANGSILTPTFLDLFHGTDAITGHNHEGLDADGSCPKISLESVATILTGIDGAKITVAFVTIEQTTSFHWVTFDNYVLLHIGEMIGVSNSVDLEIAPDTVWTSNILPLTEQRVNVLVHDSSLWTPGQLIIPIANNANWILSMQDANNDYQSGGFAAANNKGVGELTVVYFKG